MTFMAPSTFRRLPPVWEIALPFNIDASGEVAYDSDPVKWAINHILAILLTNPGERVMRPTYGAGIYGFVWETQDPLVEQNIIATINTQLATYEPNIIINELEFVQTQLSLMSGVVTLDVAFTVGNSPTIYTFSMSVNGNQVEITA
jgi:phage baseplate assembly protein W